MWDVVVGSSVLMSFFKNEGRGDAISTHGDSGGLREQRGSFGICSKVR